jgi:hypothetical protein
MLGQRWWGKGGGAKDGGGSRTRTYEGIASGFTVRPLCRSGHSPSLAGDRRSGPGRAPLWRDPTSRGIWGICVPGVNPKMPAPRGWPFGDGVRIIARLAARMFEAFRSQKPSSAKELLRRARLANHRPRHVPGLMSSLTASSRATQSSAFCGNSPKTTTKASLSALRVYRYDLIGGRTRARTLDPLIKSQLLYQLSYAPVRVSRTRRGITNEPASVQPRSENFAPRCDDFTSRRLHVTASRPAPARPGPPRPPPPPAPPRARAAPL